MPHQDRRRQMPARRLTLPLLLGQITSGPLFFSTASVRSAAGPSCNRQQRNGRIYCTACSDGEVTSKLMLRSV